MDNFVQSANIPQSELLRTTDLIQALHLCPEIRAYDMNMTVAIKYIRIRENKKKFILLGIICDAEIFLGEKIKKRMFEFSLFATYPLYFYG